MLVFQKEIPFREGFFTNFSLTDCSSITNSCLRCQKFCRLEKPELKSFPGIIKTNGIHGSSKGKTARKFLKNELSKKSEKPKNC